MTKKIILIAGLCLGLFSCIQSKQFNKQDEVPASITSVFDQMINDTKGNTPDTMQVGDYAYFQILAAASTQPPVTVGYESYKVISRGNKTVQLKIGDQTVTADAVSFAIVATAYDASNPPVQQTQKELDCDYVPQYKIWASGCFNPTDLPPFQNYFLYNGFADDGQELFYNLQTSTGTESLPQLNVSANNCYNFTNCQMNLSYMELDVNGQNNVGNPVRIHSTNSFSSQLPYLASNPMQCSQTLEVFNNQEVPYQQCYVLAEFAYGQPPAK